MALSLHEVWQKLLTVLAADATLTAMLADGAQGVFYDEGSAPAVLRFPAVRLRVLNDGPVSNVTGRGLFRCLAEISVFGVDQALNERILDRIEQLLDVPREVADGFTTATFLVTNCYRGSTVRVPTRIEQDGRQVIQLASDWFLRVKKKA